MVAMHIFSFYALLECDIDGKNHIGDFVDWASTDLRKPFLHYLHKYKGKGDPRISRALINLLNVNERDTILDPFVGSGAFIADAPTMGINAIGIEVLNIGRETGNSRASENISPHLANVISLKGEIENIDNKEIRTFLLVLLSQKIVEYSEKRRAYDIIISFKSYVEDRYLTLYATKKLAELLDLNLSGGTVTIIKGDSTNMSEIKDNSIDGILTSPPYFDALDYIGNNMLSCFEKREVLFDGCE